MKNLTQEKKIKITILIIFLIILIIMIFVIKDKKNNQQKEITNNNLFNVVNDYQLFFFASDNVNIFINKLAVGTNIEKYNLLYEGFISDNNITLENVHNKFNKYRENDIFKPKIIKSYNLNNSIVIYMLSGKIVREEYETEKIINDNVKYMLFIDYDNQSMAIYPLSKNFDEEYFVKKIDKNLSIENKANNSYQGGNLIDKDTICLMYLSSYLSMINSDIDDAYKITKGFTSKKEFENYIKNKTLSTIIYSCSLYQKEDGTNRRYTIYDSNDNKYVFYEDSIMNYTVSITK